MAAILAERGLTGPAGILEGPQGVFRAMSNDADMSAIAPVSETALPTWKIHQCSFKPWPACRHAHPAIDAVLTILHDTGIQASEIKNIHVLSYKDAMVFCDNPKPTNTAQAKFSIQHAIAAVCLYGKPQLAHYEADVINHKAIDALRQRITLSVDADIERKFPQHYGARVQIDRVSGESETLYLTDTLGDPERPMSEQQIYQKLAMLADSAGIAGSTIDALCAFDWNAEQPIEALSIRLRQTLESGQ
jgi:2-methylcitrate dehydratase PrpD